MTRLIDWNAATVPINVPVDNDGTRYVATLKFPLALLLKPSELEKLRSDMGIGEAALMGVAEKVKLEDSEAMPAEQAVPGVDVLPSVNVRPEDAPPSGGLPMAKTTHEEPGLD
ncbi:MAG: hypothetical protein ACJ76P_12025 [Actinomycetota bacterium]